MLLDVIEAYFREVWEESSTEAVHRWIAQDIVIIGLEGHEQRGIAEFLLFQRMVLSQYRDLRFRVLRSVENGEWVAVCYEVRAISIESGRPIARHAICVRCVEHNMALGHVLRGIPIGAGCMLLLCLAAWGMFL